jgi:hypothetical protein
MKHIKKDELEKLARLQCALPEFSCAFNCNESTIRERIREFYDMTFTEFIKHYGAGGHTSLRRLMWTKALKGDTKMQIFLAQNHLGMSEKTDNKHEVIPPKFVRIIDDIDTGDDHEKPKPKAKAKPKKASAAANGKRKPKQRARSGRKP